MRRQAVRVSVLRPTLAPQWVGVQSSAHQHRCWPTHSVASANGACARTPKPPARQRVWCGRNSHAMPNLPVSSAAVPLCATMLISVGGGVCGRWPHSRLPTRRPAKYGVHAVKSKSQRWKTASVGWRTRTTLSASASTSSPSSRPPPASARSSRSISHGCCPFTSSRSIGRAGGPGIRSPAHARAPMGRRASIRSSTPLLAHTLCGKREWGFRPDTQTTCLAVGLVWREQRGYSQSASKLCGCSVVRHHTHLGGRWGLRAQAPFAVAHPAASQVRRSRSKV